MYYEIETTYFYQNGGLHGFADFLTKLALKFAIENSNICIFPNSRWVYLSHYAAYILKDKALVKFSAINDMAKILTIYSSLDGNAQSAIEEVITKSAIFDVFVRNDIIDIIHPDNGLSYATYKYSNKTWSIPPTQYRNEFIDLIQIIGVCKNKSASKEEIIKEFAKIYRGQTFAAVAAIAAIAANLDDSVGGNSTPDEPEFIKITNES